jgi:hypothetical protein
MSSRKSSSRGPRSARPSSSSVGSRPLNPCPLDLSSPLSDGLEPGTLLVLVAILIAVAAAGAVVGLVRLMGVLLRALGQLFSAIVLLLLCLVLIMVWGCDRIEAAGGVIAPAGSMTLAPLR